MTGYRCPWILGFQALKIPSSKDVCRSDSQVLAEIKDRMKFRECANLTVLSKRMDQLVKHGESMHSYVVIANVLMASIFALLMWSAWWLTTWILLWARWKGWVGQTWNCACLPRPYRNYLRGCYSRIRPSIFQNQHPIPASLWPSTH